MKKLFAVILTLFATVAVSSNLYGHDGLEFEADLSGANVVPACTSPAEGEGEFNYNPATKLLSYEIEFEDLLAPDLAAHIHLPALPGANGPPVITIAGGVDRHLPGLRPSAVRTSARWGPSRPPKRQLC